jgi:hypothetical protein
VYFAVSRHGFGHATRVASVAAELARLRPDLRLILNTAAPRWVLDGYLDRPFTVRDVPLDAGVAQPDSLTVDLPATLAAARRLEVRAGDLVASEAAYLRAAGVRLVVADLPPLAGALAAAAGVPCWGMGNFGWDFIYGAWGGPFAELAGGYAAAYAGFERLFRLPFHEPMAAFPHVIEAGLTGGSPRGDPAELRRQIGLVVPRDRCVLLTFGGLGVAGVPYTRLTEFAAWQFVTFDANAPNLTNLVRLDARRIRPVDAMPLCGRIVAKPGYSTFAEAARLGLPIATFARPGFAEAEVLVAGMRRHLPHQIVPLGRFLAGDWGFLNQAPEPPTTDRALPTDGSTAIARSIAGSVRI